MFFIFGVSWNSIQNINIKFVAYLNSFVAAAFPTLVLHCCASVAVAFPMKQDALHKSQIRTESGVIRVNNQLDALFNVSISLLYMFRAT